ncbi:MAG: hypothetical protein ACYC4R_00830 [Anaerolineae bacterium]
MKTVRVMLFVALLVAGMVLTMPASAQTPSWTFGSAFQLQNLEDVMGNINIIFYDDAGTIVKTVPDTIDGGSSKNYFAVALPGGGDPLPDGFSGSAVIESDVELRAIHNLYANNFAYNATSAGYNTGATSIGLPLIQRGNSNNNTRFYVQNAGDVAATVMVTYTAGLYGTSYADPVTYTIPVGASKMFDQATLTNLGSRFVGSATVVSTNGVPIVATVIQIGPNTLYAYDGFTTGDTNPIAPLFQYDNSGYISSIQIQNAGTLTTTVTVSYTPGSNGVACTETQTIGPGGAGTFGLLGFYRAEVGCDCYANNNRNRFIGSAQVTGNTEDQPLMAVVNQLQQAQGKAASYSGFPSTEALSVVSLPQMLDRNSGFWTSLNMVNVGPDTTVTVDFVGKDLRGAGSVVTSTMSFDLDNGESKVVLLAPGSDPAFPIADGWVGSATVRGADAVNDKLLVVVNKVRGYSGEYAGDTFESYNGFGYVPVD